MGQAVNNGRCVLALQIIEGAEDAFFAFDAQLRVTFANPAAEQLLGMKEAEVVGKPVWEACPVAGGLLPETACRRAMDERVTVNLASFHAPLQKWYDVQATPSEDGGLLVQFRDITERMRAEEAVRAERQRLRDVLDQLPAYLVLLSPDYHVPFANRFFRERFGESNGRRCYEYLFQRTEPCEICDTYTVLKTGSPHRWEWTGPDKCNYDVYDFPFADVDGSKLIMEVGLDITERKRAGADLAKHREHLEELVKERTSQLEAANARLQAEIAERKQAAAALRRQAQFPEQNPNPVLRVARDSSLLYANAPARTWLASLGWAAGQRLPPAVEALISGACGQSRPAETEAGDSHGHIFWLSAMQPAGENYVNVYGRDITERKQAEEKIRHQNAVLGGINRILREALTCDTEEQLGRACLAVAEEVTQSKCGFLAEVKADGRLADIAISDPGWEACRMKNIGKPELSGGSKINGIYGRVLLDGKSFFTNDPRSHPDSIGVPEGHPPLTSFLGVPLKHEGKTTGIIAVANREGGYRPQDLEAMEALALAIVQVFMRKRAEQAVRLGEERLRQAQKMESIGVLAGGIAHDFNNLLTGIMGNASLLQDEVREESRDMLAAVIHASEKAADLTRQMLAYAGKGRFFIEPLDLARIASDVTDLLRASLPKKVDLKLAVTPDLPGIEADRGQVQQIVMNLVINGAESIGTDQTGTVTITTKAVTVSEADRISNETTGESVAPGEYVCLEVEDTGCGMDRETRAKIFDPFFTTKFVGRGLGLAAVAGIVQAQRGAIQLESRPGKGTTFRVFLPAVGAPDAPLRTGQTADLHGSGTVLLVDDEAAVRDFARAALERQGYKVLSANNGQEAVRTFEENAERVNLVLLDLTMPVMGGDEAIGLLRSRRTDVKVIVMSGYGESEARRMFAGKGVSGFLQKPFTAAGLAEKVKAVLAETR